MSYCLNPGCQKPLNPKNASVCKSCGTQIQLLLRNRYRIIRPLGGGGFGRTFLAEDEDKLKEPCVVKQLVPQVQGTKALQKATRLFQEEARRLQQLGEHPQIPTLYAYFEQDRYLYLVQQLIEGQTLQQELQQGLFSEAGIWQLLTDLLPLLQFIHAHHVVHRDIKPENIIRRQKDGRLVLIDFGVAKHLTATAIAKPGTSIGSFGYASLEQMNSGEAYPASDLYSLGSTCFHLLTGIHPSGLWTEKGYSWVTDWRQYLKSPISQKLEQVLDKLLQKDVQQRYRSANEVLHDLNNSAQPTPTPVSLEKTQPPPSAIGYSQDDEWAEASANLPSRSSRIGDRFRLKHDKRNLPLKNKLLLASIVLLLALAAYSYRHLASFPVLTGHTRAVNTVAISPDGQKLASGSDDETIKIWSLVKLQELRTLKGHKNWVYSVAISPDSQTVVSGSKDNTIKVWNLNTGQEIHTLSGHTSFVNSVAISPNPPLKGGHGGILASGSYDRTIKLWNLNTGDELRTLKGHTAEVLSVAISPDGQKLASGSTDRTIKIWNLNTGEELRTLNGHTGDVNSVAFSPTGQEMVSVSDDRTIKIWNPNTGRQIRTLTGHTADVNFVAFSPDGQKIATASDDKSIKIWYISTGENIATLKGHSAPVWAVAFSPNGQSLVSASEDKTIRIWQVPQ